MSAVISDNALTILKQRYLVNGESVEDMFRRVAGGNQDYYDLMADLRFLPNSPTLFNAGLNNGCTLSACFVFDVDDTMLDSPRSIVHTRAKAIAVAKAGGGVGYWFGNIRSKGSPIKSVHRVACGPVAVLRDYHAVRQLVTQGGKRDLAQMGMLPCYHDDIEEFIHCKDEDPQGLSSFNISVSWTDEWIRRAFAGESKAKSLWDQQVESAWKTGCPGMSFWNRLLDSNPNVHLGHINATNPCQPGFATVLTPEGIRTFDEVHVGDEIWSGQQWTKIVRKVCTGEKRVFRYRTTAGHFIGTEDHRVVQCGEKIPVKDADCLDASYGPRQEGMLRNSQAVVDGWVLGDGSVHKASGNLVYLILGKKDGEFIDLFKDFIIRDRFGLKDGAYEVTTTLDHVELPKTYKRRIPARYRRAHAEKACSFLSGLYSANGSVCGGRITLKSASLQLILDVQEMLSGVGIRSYYTVNKSKVVRFKNGNYKCRQSYDLNITKDRKEFVRLIGFCQEDKKIRAEEAAARINSPRTKSSYEIVRVKDLGRHTVYDITVDCEDHTYWTGGVLVSNCGETPNRSDEPCNLGSLNLRRYVTSNREVDYTRLYNDACLATRFLDDILDRNVFPHPDITAAALLTRKLGLGVMGWADMLALLHIHYDTEKAIDTADQVMNTISDAARSESKLMAGEKGPYKGYDPEKTIGLCSRNETCTSIAPTGTIALIADCSSSIEPHFDLEWERTTFEGIKMKEKISCWEELDGFVPKTARDISPEWHVRHQAAFQKHTDLGVSKTVNLPNSATKKDVSDIYRMMFETGCKGGTIYRDGCRNEQVLVSKGKTSVFTTGIKDNGRHHLPNDRNSITHKFKINGVAGYLTVGLFDDGTPAEIFLRFSKLGSTVGGMLDSWAISFSIALQNGTPLESLCRHHKGTMFEPRGMTGNPDLPICTSIPDYVVRWLEQRFLNKKENNKKSSSDSGMFCPDCGSPALYSAGCLSCSNKTCGWNRCG